MNFKKVNNIAGWAVGAIATLVYILTAEKAGSFWDCGEFVSACYKVQLPHPPGAPLFVLLGRFFIVLFGDNPATAAKAVNIMNAFASGATILFLFWTITHYARKLTSGFSAEPDNGQIYTIIGAGAVGALAYTFTDSFWFSAVEGEVYALSSFFTALAFWAMVKWEQADYAAGTSRELKNRADRWIVFLFFALGLSIGIHLLGLLTIPAIVMMYYFRRYNYTRWGAVMAFVIGCVITGLVQVAIIQLTVKMAGRFDILFVNSLGLPFFSGFAFFFILIGVLIWAGLRLADKKGWSFLRLGLWCLAFMLLGYSSYITTLERSNANPSLDMNKVDNPMSLVYYLSREQYGSQPILYGTHFLAQPKGVEDGKSRYVKGPKNYIELPGNGEYTYDDKDYQLFPRTWDPSNDQQHANTYIDWLSLPTINANTVCMVTGVGEGIVQTQDQTGKQENHPFDDDYGPAPDVREGKVLKAGDPIAVKIPTYGTNVNWFFTYQMGFMYWRYFMWNFSGRQNDIQGGGNKRDGNWITGIAPIDNIRLGDQSKLPQSIQHNKATNKLFLLPFLLGLIGCVYQFIKDRKDWIASFLLFFFTGLAVVIYLNQPGNQPRERDYAFAGSFYAFAIWIGLAVVALVRMAREKEDKKTFLNTTLFGGLATVVIMILSDANNNATTSLLAAIIGGILFSALTYGLTFLIRSAAGKNFNMRTAGLAATAVCLLAPVIMGMQEWDDHDRSQKELAPDMAKNYLLGLPKNAILFTFGDNDTYPLWYAQETEGVRPDVRIINTSLLGIEWYVNELRYKVNESPAIDVLWTPNQVRGLGYIRNQQGGEAQTAPLLDVMKNRIGPLLNGDDKSKVSAVFPAHLTVPVDVAYVKSAGLVKPTDSVANEITLDLPQGKSYFTLDELTILNVLAANGWKRPICFTNPYGATGFSPYLRQEGIIYRLTPVKVDRASAMDADKTQNLLLTTFKSGGAQKGTVYYDEENRRHLLSIRSTFAQAASSLADEGRKPEAITLLNKSEGLISTKSLPYAMVSRGNQHNQMGLLYLEAAYKAGDKPLADKIKVALRKDLQDQKAYYQYLRDERPEFYSSMAGDESFCDQALNMISQMEKDYSNAPKLAAPETVTPPPAGARKP